MVGERSVSLRRCLVKDAGGIRSANADMSSDNGGEKPPRRKPKVSCSTFIGGESAPKARQRCVADGKQVNIPAPSYDAMGGRIAEGCLPVGIGSFWFIEGA